MFSVSLSTRYGVPPSRIAKDRVDLRHAGERRFRCVAQIIGKRQQHRPARAGAAPAPDRRTAPGSRSGCCGSADRSGAEAVGDLQRQEPCRRAGRAQLMAAARVEQQNLAPAWPQSSAGRCDTAAAAQHHAQLQLLMQVHGAVHHVDDKHGASRPAWNGRSAHIHCKVPFVSPKTHLCRASGASSSVISLPRSFIITVTGTKNKGIRAARPENREEV